MKTKAKRKSLNTRICQHLLMKEFLATIKESEMLEQRAAPIRNVLAELDAGRVACRGKCLLIQAEFLEVFGYPIPPKEKIIEAVNKLEGKR